MRFRDYIALFLEEFIQEVLLLFLFLILWILLEVRPQTGLTLKRPVAAPDYDVFRQHSVDFQKGLVQIKKSYFILFYYINEN